MLAQDRGREGRLAQREFQDGLVWKSLGPAGKFAEDKKQVLSPAATEYSDGWLKTLPNESWAERYGGGWRDVQELMAASREEARLQRSSRPSGAATRRNAPISRHGSHVG